MCRGVTWLGTMATFLALAVASTVPAARAADSKPTRDVSRFPLNQFPANYFEGLNGSVVWLDSNGGANTRVRDATIWKNFTDLTGVKMQSDFSGNRARFDVAEQRGGSVPWSLVEFGNNGACLQAQKAGYLQKLDRTKVPLDRLLDGSYNDYCVNAQKSGAVLTYSTDKWPNSGPHPENITDLFDIARFPGKRCMYKGPEYGAVFESALLADGVPPANVYKVLATPEGVDRALKKLDSIKDSIVWWNSGDQALQLFTSGECDLGVTWSGRAYNAVTKDGAHLAISWKNAVLTTGAWAVPRGAPNYSAGQAAIAMWILDKEGQKAYVEGMTYTTAIRDIEYPAQLRSWIAAGENAQVALDEDVVFYQDNLPTLTEKLNGWFLQR